MKGASLDSATLGVKQRILMIVESSPQHSRHLANAVEAESATACWSRPIRSGRLSGFAGGMTPADCVLFSTSNLGEQALDAFNRFGQHASTARVPAVLLLGSKHGEWAAKAKVSPLHAVVNSPFTVQELRGLIERVLHEGDELAASNSSLLKKS